MVLNKVAIVTGSSSGFGLLTSIELAKSGFQVLATMRNIEKADVFKSITSDPEILNRITPLELDVTINQTFDQFQRKLESLDRVDLLVNNAGYAMGGFVEQVSVEEYKKQFDTNVFGLMAVTKIVLPRMRKQRFGTIINISSTSGRLAFPGLSPYVASKYAIEGYTESLRLEVSPLGIQVALIEPGSYKTNIWTSGMKLPKSKEPIPDYEGYMDAILSELEKGKSKHGDPIEVANLIVELSQKKILKKLRYPVGNGTKLMIFVKNKLHWRFWEKLVHRKIFK
ncbi:SDR family oxidoreductase [Bacillaceae bacterium S4-13-58]